MSSTDSDWEHFAQEDPYFYVMTEDKYKNANIDEDAIINFYARGQGQIDRVLKTLSEHFDLPASRGVALDFGCGVGRLLFPLAKVSRQAIGIDISDTMMTIAAENAKKFGIENVTFVRSDDNLDGVEDNLDLVTSSIVFQHIPVSRGYAVLNCLLEKMSSGGLAYLHFTTVDLNTSGRMLRRIKNSKYIRRTSEGLFFMDDEEGRTTPEMQMNNYDLNRLHCILYDHGIEKVLINHTSHKVCLGVELFFQKP